MKRFLLRVFFHFRFWPRTLWRFFRLLFGRKKLKVKEVGLDRAFYFEGSWVILSWEVENALFITVNHPGGFYHGSDSTWFTASRNMVPLRITFRGLGKKIVREFEVPVKAYGKKPAAMRHLSAEMNSSRIHRGPVLKTRSQVYFRQQLRFGDASRLLEKKLHLDHDDIHTNDGK